MSFSYNVATEGVRAKNKLMSVLGLLQEQLQVLRTVMQQKTKLVRIAANPNDLLKVPRSNFSNKKTTWPPTS